MLVLNRHIDEVIWVGDIKIMITDVKTKGRNTGRVSIGIDAPDDIRILRDELRQKGENHALRTH